MARLILASVAVLALVLPGAASAAKPARIVGTYRTLVASEHGGQDRWLITFRANGQIRHSLAGRLVAWGQWDVSSGVVTLTDFGGQAACHGPETIGRYRYYVRHSALRLITIRDPCQSRRERMSSRALTRV